MPARIAVLSVLVATAAGHGGLTTPLPRNSFDAPLNPDQPGTGGGMTNYYDDGCVPGCDSCLHHGATGAYPSGADGCSLLPGGCFAGEGKQENPWAAPSNVRCTVAGKPVGRGIYNVTVPGSDTLPDHARTWNRNATAVNTNPLIGDWGRFAPWRAPGASNIGDPCGLLCDHCHDPDDPDRPPLFNGSALPPLKSAPTVWKAGSVAEAGWGLAVNHGGGYQYRLCKKGQPMTETCFQKGALDFATQTTTIRYTDGSAPEFTIPVVDVTEGVVPAGSTWRRDPIPACACDGGCSCRFDAPGGGGGGRPGRGGGSYSWMAAFNVPYSNSSDGPPGCKHGTMFEPPWPQGYGYESERFDAPGADRSSPVLKSPKFNYEMVDQLKVPEEKGEYVLSWRWDTEQKGQVWSGCADIVIE